LTFDLWHPDPIDHVSRPCPVNHLYESIRYDIVYLMMWRVASLIHHTEQTEKLKKKTN